MKTSKNYLCRLLSQEQATERFSLVYHGISGAYIASNARQRHNLKGSHLTYGEVLFDTFADILQAARPAQDAVFYDLGSGTGKPVLTAALTHTFSQVIGIELLPELRETAQNAAIHLHDTLRVLKWDGELYPHIDFREGNFFDADFSDADIVFASLTCFDDKMVAELARKLERMLAPGSRVISLTKHIPSSRFSVLSDEKYLMSWGESTVYIQEKVR